jgi:molecular chaperone DnaK (HSP70)
MSYIYTYILHMYIYIYTYMYIYIYIFIGGTSRVSMVKQKLGEILELDPAAMNYGLKTTMNSDEAVARGGIICMYTCICV